jgi:hypothetical protein
MLVGFFFKEYRQASTERRTHHKQNCGTSSSSATSSRPSFGEFLRGVFPLKIVPVGIGQSGFPLKEYGSHITKRHYDRFNVAMI